MKWTNIGVTTTVDVNTLPIYEIWMEGCVDLGWQIDTRAYKLGWGRGNTFNEAVAEYVKRTETPLLEWKFDREYMGICFEKLFDNEKDARKSRG